MLAQNKSFWVPCDAQSSRRDVKLASAQTAHPETPSSSCASRQTWTGSKTL